MEPWQTRASEFHPYMVDAVDKLPPNLRTAAATALPPGTTVGRAFVVPADYRSDGDAPPRPIAAQALIFTDGGLVHVQAALPGEALPPPRSVQPEKLLWLRSSHLLLYGRLELVAAGDGKAEKIKVEFNAVGWRLMHAEWHSVVGRAIGLPPLAPEEEHALSAEETQLLAAAPEKFVDGLGRYGLYTGEVLLGVAFQPAIWKQNLIAFDEQLRPNTLLALTDASVLILEEESALVRKSEQFGLIITRIPRRAVTALTSTIEDPLQVLSFALARDGITSEQNVLLTPEVAEAWLKVWNR